MLRRVDSRCEDACVVLGYPRGSVLALRLRCAAGQPGSAHVAVVILDECWCALIRATFRASGPHFAPPRISLQIPETLAACGFSEAFRLSLLETASLRRSAGLAREASATNSLAEHSKHKEVEVARASLRERRPSRPKTLESFISIPASL